MFTGGTPPKANCPLGPSRSGREAEGRQGQVLIHHFVEHGRIRNELVEDILCGVRARKLAGKSLERQPKQTADVVEVEVRLINSRHLGILDGDAPDRDVFEAKGPATIPLP